MVTPMSPFGILSGALVPDKNILPFNNVFTLTQQCPCVRLFPISQETVFVHIAVILGWFQPSHTPLFLINAQFNMLMLMARVVVERTQALAHFVILKVCSVLPPAACSFFGWPPGVVFDQAFFIWFSCRALPDLLNLARHPWSGIKCPANGA